MADTEMKKVSAWIPQETLIKLEEKGYQNKAEAIRLGLEYLIRDSNMEDIRNPTESTDKQMESKENRLESIVGDIRNPTESNGILKARIEELERRNDTERTYLKKEIERLTIALQESPDPVESAEVRAHFEGLQKLLEEKDKSIERLEREVETLSVFAHYFKNVDVKQLEAPAEQKVKKSFLTRVKEVFIPG
jgi:hypothetical protein